MTRFYSAAPNDAQVRAISLRIRFLLEMVPWGCFMAGNWGIFAASHSDLFAQQPELSARIQASEHMWREAIAMPASLFGAFMVPRLWATRWRYIPWLLSAAVAATMVVLSFQMEETLDRCGASALADYNSRTCFSLPEALK